ncbi:Formin_homology 2 domain-containing protein [Hexamita inflata]|uniref:Formin homology 2 domain-containing protein n=1 Tax=Hexamita inflata TaxID=28002 RepID=A0AA86NHL5_9EUKA|nr:Formin homology 2 domain-containing protein [Hexamita inflata]
MSEEELKMEQAFIYHLTEKGTTEQQIQVLLKKVPTAQQRKAFMQASGNSQQNQKDAVLFINDLQLSIKNNMLPEIRIISELLQYVTENQFAIRFRENDGLSLLFTLVEKTLNMISFLGQESYLQQINTKTVQKLSAQALQQIQQNEDLLKQLMKCIRKLMDSKDGFKITLAHHSALTSLVRIMSDSHVAEMRELALYVMTFFCVLPPVYYASGAVLSAFDSYAMVRNVERFSVLIRLGQSILKENLTEYNAKILCHLWIIFSKLTSDSFNLLLSSRDEIRKELVSQDLTQFELQINKQIALFLSGIVSNDCYNKLHPFISELKKSITGEFKQTFNLSFYDYYYDMKTPEYFKINTCVKQILNLLSIRDQFYEQEQSDQKQIAVLQTNNILLNRNFKLHNLLELLGTRIDNLQPLVKGNFHEAILNLLAVTENCDQNSQQALIYAFEGLKNFSKQLLNFKQECDEVHIDDAFKTQAEGSQLCNFNLFDVLYQPEKLTNFYLIKEIENMLGKDVLEVIQESKKLSMKYINYKSGLRTTSIDVKNQLRIVPQEEFQQVQMINSMSDKEMATQLKNDLNASIKDRQDLLDQIKSLKLQLDEAHKKQSQFISKADQKAVESDKTQQPKEAAKEVVALSTSLPSIPELTDIQPKAGQLPPPPAIPAPNGLPLPPPPSNLLPPPAGLPPPPPPMSLPQSPMGLPPPPPFVGVPGSPMNLPPPPMGLPPGSPVPMSPNMPLPSSPSTKPKKQEVNKPSNPLKSFFWDKLSDFELKDGVLWNNMSDVKLPSAILEEIENGFQQKKAFADTTSSPLLQTQQVDKKQLISVLDGRRAQAVGIAMQKLKLQPADIYAKVLAMEDESIVDTLVACCPADSECEQVQQRFQTDTDKSLYSKTDQFVIELMVFPKLQQRLRNWQFVKSFQYELNKHRPAILLVNKFFSYILENEGLKKLLQVMISVGNFVNAGSPRGQAFGVKLKSLQKFSDAKDANGKSLLYFVLKSAKTDYKEDAKILEYIETLKNDPSEGELAYQKLGQPVVSIQEFGAICSKLKKISYVDESESFQKLQNFLKSLKNCDEFQSGPEDQYKANIKKFIQTAEFQCEKVDIVNQQVMNAFEKAKKYYAEPNSTIIEDFFTYFFEFSANCDSTLIQINEIEEKMKLVETRKIKIDGAAIQQISETVKLVSEKDIEVDASADGLMDLMMNNFMSKGQKKRK